MVQRTLPAQVNGSLARPMCTDPTCNTSTTSRNDLRLVESDSYMDPFASAWSSFVGSTTPILDAADERSCAAALDAHGVAWEHRPTTFVLAFAADGQVTQTACPAFYVPRANVFLHVLADGDQRRDGVDVARAIRRRYPDVEVLAVRVQDVVTLARQWRTRDVEGDVHSRSTAVPA